MKRVKSLLIALFVMMMGITLQNCGGINAEYMADYFNKQCPMDQGNGISIVSAEAQGSDLILNCKVENENITLDAINAGKDQLKASMVQMYKTNEEIKPYTEYIKENNSKCIYRYQVNDEGSVDIEITADDLK